MNTLGADGPRGQDDRPWTGADVPDQRGRIFIVTGANSGLGFEASRVQPAPSARDPIAAKFLWELSGQLTLVRYAALEP